MFLMRVMNTMSRVSKSYDYNALCDSCGFKYKASELFLRWDGLNVCKWDWEQRHPLDFYRTRNDTHLLPFTGPDDLGDLTFTPACANLTIVGTVTTTSTYSGPDLGNFIEFKILFTVASASSVASGAANTTNLPVASVTAGSCTVLDATGKVLGTGSIGAGTSTFTMPQFSANTNNVIVSGKYGV